MEPFVRAAALTNFTEVATHRGLDAGPLLRAYVAGRGRFTDPRARVPLRAVVDLLEHAARAGACPGFGLQMAESRQLPDFAAISLLASHQRTLRGALRVVVEYRRLLGESLAIGLEDAGGQVVLRETCAREGPGSAREATELALGVTGRLCAATLGRGWRPRSVHFTHAAPRSTRVHERIFQCRPVFNADFDGFVCAAAPLERPNPDVDLEMARYAARLLEPLPGQEAASFVPEVQRAIYILLPLGLATIEQVAQSTGMNVRTLQRRLDEAGTTFSELICTVRRELVQRYIEDRRHSLGRIARILGYTTPSSFTRWFIAQFGMPPQQWRSARAAAAIGRRARRVPKMSAR